VQKRDPEHPTCLTDGAGSNIDPADPEQLLLPSLLFGLFYCYGFFTTDNLPADCDVIFAFSICQQSEVTNPYITFW
jgi:hypothetical protein